MVDDLSSPGPAMHVHALKPNPLSLLVVDDYPPGLMLLMQQFIFFGYRVSAASGGEDAFKQWVGGEFDAVITDSRMPDVDGSALTRSIRQYEKQASVSPCLIIGFTANAVAEERERCLSAGMDECFFKPMDLAELDRYIKARLLGPSPGGQPAGQDDDGGLGVLVRQLERLAVPDPSTMPLLVRVLRETTQADINQLEQLAAKRDFVGLAELAHRIRGAAGIIGLEEVVSACYVLEIACDEPSSGDAVCRGVERLQGLMRDLSAALDEVVPVDRPKA